MRGLRAHVCDERRTHHDGMFNATGWYPYPTLTRREPCTAPVHDLASKEALVLLPSGSVQSVSWQSMALSGRALEGPVTAEYWQFGV